MSESQLCRKCHLEFSVEGKPCAGCFSDAARMSRARYSLLRREPWNGQTPVALYNHPDKVFLNRQALEDWLYDENRKRSDVMLVHCKPLRPVLVEASDIFGYAIPDDDDEWQVPEHIQALIDQLNEELVALGVLSWTPWDVAVEDEAEP